MSKLKGFFVGIFLLIAIIAMMFLVSLVYRAGERSSIKSYMFQMANNSGQRIGMLQNIDDISANDLRNKLIKKYVAEYFKVIPGDKNVMTRPTLYALSDANVFKNWKLTEGKTIADMSEKRMFRLARVRDDGIATYNKIEGDDDNTMRVYYKVKYYTSTWTESNTLATEPVYDQGTIYLEIDFEPGIRKTILNKKFSVRKYLESGKDPAGLFKFRVVGVGDKVKR